jgi:hypothetical protein
LKNAGKLTDPVDRQLDAYNERDIDKFLSAYARDAVITRLPAGAPGLHGHAAIRARYAALFLHSPALAAVVQQRVVVGDWVIDHEIVSGACLPSVGEALVAYQVGAGLIRFVYIMQ